MHVAWHEERHTKEEGKKVFVKVVSVHAFSEIRAHECFYLQRRSIHIKGDRGESLRSFGLCHTVGVAGRVKRGGSSSRRPSRG